VQHTRNWILKNIVESSHVREHVDTNIRRETLRQLYRSVQAAIEEVMAITLKEEKQAHES
jgi:hypothetical protein